MSAADRARDRRPAPSRRRRVLTVALVGLGVLLAGVALLWVFQRRLIYLPDAAAVPPGLVDGGVDVTLRTDDGLALTALYVRPPAVAGCRPTVLVAPGNAGNRGDRVPLARALAAAGFGVLLLDYRGYGGNPGSPTEDGLAMDVAAARAYLIGPAGLSPSEVLLLGESLGGGVATGLAIDPAGPPAGLLLRSPFTELADVAARQFPIQPVRWLLRDRYPVAASVGAVDAPVTVVYGTADSLVPPDQSLAVAAAAGARVVAVDGAEHNDPALAHGPALVAAMLELAGRAGCPPP